MRKLILFMHVSLDGYIKAAGKDETGRDKTVTSSGEDPGALETVVPDLIEDADTLLLGRVVADELLGYWLNAEASEPDLTKGGIAYARWATGARKAVISHTEETLPWANTELLLVKSDEDLVHAVTTLKQQPGKNIVFHGGVRTAQDLTRLNLIDEYQLVVPAVALGAGEPLFKNLPDRLKLELVQVTELEAGGIFLRYRPATTV
ncbi:MAG TPA: dihydrofolate reductase family protein [Gaiellaceae bacterium]|nr:dihydrofolate reductase family protein [Gaiellaceae bacterium]